MGDFIGQLRQRHVIRVAIACLVVAWLALQVADVAFPALGLVENSLTSCSWLENDPDLEPLREHPRSRAFLARLEG